MREINSVGEGGGDRGGVGMLVEGGGSSHGPGSSCCFLRTCEHDMAK